MEPLAVTPEDSPGSNPGSLVQRLPLKGLGLRAGLPLQTRRLVEGARKKEAQFVGAIEGKGVMVGPLSDEAGLTGLCAQEVCVVRGFTGQFEFSFVSKVLQTFEQPFVYALLAYPKVVDARLVRQSMRLQGNWAAQVSSTPQTDALLPATLVDLSAAGAMLKAPTSVGAVGAPVYLHLLARVDDTPTPLVLQARICHSQWFAESHSHCVGVAFTHTSAHEKLVLNYLLRDAESV